MVLTTRRMGREERMQRYRDKMHASADSAAAQLLDALIAANAQLLQLQADRVEMPRMPAGWIVGWKPHFFNPGQRLIVLARVSCASFDESFQLPQLVDPD